MSDSETCTPKPLIGFTVDQWRGLAPSTIIDALKFIGVKFIEINKSVFDDLEKSIKSLKGVKTSFHLPYHSDHKWDLTFEGEQADWLINLLNEYKDKLSIQHLVCHPPEHLPDDRDPHIYSKTLLANLKRIELPVYIENIMSQPPDEYYNFINLAKKELGSQVKGMCWDACHFLVAGYDPVKRFRMQTDDIGCIHLSDCFPDKDAHMPFTRDGSLPLENILKMLVENKYNGYITLEIAPQSLKDISAYINSYLHLLKKLDKAKYYSTKLRLFLLKPLINKLVSHQIKKLTIINSEHKEFKL